MRSIYEKEPIVFTTRWTLSYLRGPLTLAQVQILKKQMSTDENFKEPMIKKRRRSIR